MAAAVGAVVANIINRKPGRQDGDSTDSGIQYQDLLWVWTVYTEATVD